ncbi:MAG: hypothetical protein M9927_07775 [Anaerolineae bacterium]|nr:hypothetical protein [Anaerolineae bacterium]
MKGFPPSAAISVLAARAFNRVDLKLTVRGEMELAYMGEISPSLRAHGPGLVRRPTRADGLRRRPAGHAGVAGQG